MFVQATDGTAAAERLTKAEPGTAHVPESWSPDGSTILFSIDRKGADKRLAVLSVRQRTITPFAELHSGIPFDAVFSPDGRWVAYSQGEPTAATVFVQPFPATGATYQVVMQPGEMPHHPLWSPDGKTLYYNPSPTGFAAVSVTTRPVFTFGNPTPLEKTFQMGPPGIRRMYDVMPNGRFVGVIVPGQLKGAAASAAPIHVVLNWFDELRVRVPVTGR